MQWSSAKIRATFLEYFKSKEHEIVPSAPMVLKGDPTLMFTNAGMNQFKDIFLNNSSPKFPRVTDTQKCLRVSGKHNDLEEVGVDTYHHTMFEMLGNWSFGDYFKKEAIAWSWDLLTNVFKIDKDRIYITVFKGEPSEGTELDQEAVDLWKEWTDEDRILAFDKKDNFWEMGDAGPCGPCSEIHVDIRSDEERAQVPGKDLVNKDHPQVIEIWNLVFIQFNRMASGELQPLPAKHIDTGMGFERLAMVLQGKTSNYDTDVFSPLLEKLEKLSGVKYGATTSKKDVAFRVIVDHIRAIAFSIADGQLPSNTGAGYVIRRILRRAVRYGYSFLDLKEPFMYQLVATLKSQMGHQFDELIKQAELIEKVVKEEEDSFLRTLQRGIGLFNDYKEHHHQVKGDFAFELYDTYGFPIDLTQLLAAEDNMTVDIEGFKKALEEQKLRSRKATSLKAGDWNVLLEDEKEEFVGYDYTESKVKITRYRKVETKGKEVFQLVFNLTPFYPEGGGQVGDTGYIEANGQKVSVFDTKKENNVIIHYVKELPKEVETEFDAVVSSAKRISTAANHTATHLLHQALREVLGDHVEQKGSLVNAEHLRFDFSHFQKVTSEEVQLVEEKVNQRIRQNISLNEMRSIPIEKAKEMGAMALFGEKYDDVVRVIQFDDSLELCGGTHAQSTGELGLFKITSESASAAGIRRIEAISGKKAEEFVRSQEDVLKELKGMLKNSKDIKKTVADLLAQNQQLNQQLQTLLVEKENMLVDTLKSSAKEINGVNFVQKIIDLDAASAKNVAFKLKSEIENLFLILGSKGDKPVLTLLISESLVESKDWNAGQIIRDLAKEIKGGGGGQPFFATAGGKDASGLERALAKAEQMLD
tara:strand:- start:698 stop:3304 length:2607 start_codon:yes stop_codon:yes gene_type:complete